ncbi:MAG: DUF6206 family protein [Candidatus Lokiarchaeia archaeon]|nr:DUF6206 family protein [Candidatus Lokiarchaeia archaeon]
MDVNIDLLKELERTIDTVNPERGKVPIKILGYGEITLVFEIVNDEHNYAYKRLPIFETREQAKKHEHIFREYNRFLNEEINIKTPPLEITWFESDEGKIIFYAIQEKIPSESVGNKVIHEIGTHDTEVLVLKALREMKKVWTFNKENEIFDVGLDGQISNFAVLNYDPNNPKVDENSQLIYVDTVPPFYRKNGDEAMEIELLTKSMPSFIRGLLKLIFLQDLIDRYYDWRLVIIDLVANFFKEQKPELIPSLIKTVNKFLKEEASNFNIEPLTFEEVQKYYKSDKFIWALYQRMRKFDRFIKTKLLRKKYDYYLPGKIER